MTRRTERPRGRSPFVGLAAPLLAALLVALGPVTPAAADEAPALRFAALPLESREATAREFAGFVGHLEYLAGRRVEHVYVARYEDLLADFAAGRLDLVFVGPLPYVELVRRRADAHPLVRFAESDGATRYRCVLAAFRGDAVRPVDLKGAAVGLPQALSTCGPLSAGGLLHREAGLRLTDVDARVLGNHETVALDIVAGEVRAGTLKESIARKYAGLGLEILAATDPLPGFVVVAGTDHLDEAAIERLRFGLLATPDTIWRTWGSSIHNGMETARDEDYAPVRRLAEGSGR